MKPSRIVNVPVFINLFFSSSKQVIMISYQLLLILNWRRYFVPFCKIQGYCLFFRTAFACWLITVVLFNMDLQYGSVGLIITGALLLLSNVSFITVNSGGRLAIRIGFDDPPKLLQLSYGWCFWLILIDGENFLLNIVSSCQHKQTGVFKAVDTAKGEVTKCASNKYH